MAADAGSWAIGSEVVLKTKLGEELRSAVFAYDSTSKVLILREPGSHNGVANLRMLPTSTIEQVVTMEAPRQPVDLRLPTIDMERCRKREERALEQAKKDADRVGTGVTREAQAIFEALGKTLPCHWKGKTIIVLVSGQCTCSMGGGHGGGQHAACGMQWGLPAIAVGACTLHSCTDTEGGALGEGGCWGACCACRACMQNPPSCTTRPNPLLPFTLNRMR